MDASDVTSMSTLCARCRGSQIFEFMRGSHVPYMEVSCVLPDPVEDSCGMCTLFKTLGDCEAGPWSRSNTESKQHADSIKRKLKVRAFKSSQRDWTMSTYRFAHPCFECGKQHDIHTLPLGPPQLRQQNLEFATGQIISATSANLDRAKMWIRNCDLHHNSADTGCTISPLRRPVTTTLRIIDCQTRLVRLLGSNEPYICLSYVWGTHIAANQSPSVGARLCNNLPKTIEDAIYVADALGIPQLWVDQYCINQHDVQMRVSTIQSMDKIYDGAALTIIAASGSDVSSGLPGIRGTARSQQQLVTIDNQTFILSFDTGEKVRSSRWNTRGWTYQEAILSPRNLVFTETQMYFHCRQSYHSEDLSRGFRFPGSLQVFSTPRFGASPDDIYELLKEYFPRDLTYESDSLAAFEGILNSYDNHKNRSSRAKHFFGIPLFYDEIKNLTNPYPSSTCSFVHGLAWYLAAPISCKNHMSASGDSGPVFPSCTWASAKAKHPKAMNGLILDLCLQKIMVIPRNILVEVRHVIHGQLDINVTSTLTTMLEDRLYFRPWIDITTDSMRIQLSPKHESNDTIDSPYADLCQFDEDRDMENQQVMALCLGMSLTPLPTGPSDLMPETYRRRIIFLLVEEADVEKGTYRRVGMWHLDCVHDVFSTHEYRNSDDSYGVYHAWPNTGIDDKALRHMSERAAQDDAEYLGTRTFRVV